jgi:hypothetical protein
MSTAEIRDKLAKGYEFEAQPLIKAGKAAVKLLTMEDLNSIIETTSRYAEYKYGKHDLSTDEGRQEAFRAAQEVTLDFSRVGSATQSFRRLIPFFNATVQAGYQTARMFSSAERSRLAPRLAKTILNNVLMGALSFGLIRMFGTDEEKEGYAQLPMAVKMENLIIPLPKSWGVPFGRIPLAQDPLARIGHALGIAALDSSIVGGDNAFGFELGQFAQLTLTDLLPSGSILQAFNDVNANRTWWGGTLEPTRLQNAAAPEKYVDTTPMGFRWASGLAYQLGLDISPIKLQYLAQQYTGFAGQMLIPFFSPDERTGRIEGASALLDVLRKRFTVDNLYTNNVGDAYYDGLQKMDSILYSARQGITASALKPGLTEEQARAAVDEAKALTSAGGALDDIDKTIDALYADAKKVRYNASLSDAEINRQTRDIQAKIVEQQLMANEIIAGYRDKYVASNVMTWLSTGAPVVRTKTAYEAMPESFQEDLDETYMQRAKAVWDASKKDAALPHPLMKFEYTRPGAKKADKIEVDADLQSGYTQAYQMTYRAYMESIGTEWEALSEEEKLDALDKAHQRAHKAAKEWYVMKKKLNIPLPPT